MELERALNKSF